MYTATLRLTGGTPGGEPIDLQVDFTDCERTKLQDFADEAEKLLKCDYIMSGAQASLRIEWNQETGGRVTPTLPAEASIESFLHRMRPFILQSETTFFPSVRSLLHQKLENDFFRYLLARQSAYWTGKYVREQIVVSDNYGTLSDDRTLMEWLNAYEYHRDKEKQERLNPARQFLSNDGLRAFFLILMVEKVKAIGLLVKIVDLVLGNRRNLEVHLANDN